LILNNPTEKRYTRLRKNIARSQLAQYSWASASQFWSLAFHSHSSCCCQQGTPYLAEEAASFSKHIYVACTSIIHGRRNSIVILPSGGQNNFSGVDNSSVIPFY